MSYRYQRDIVEQMWDELTTARAEDASLRLRVEAQEQALRAMLDMYDRHAGWCGYNKDAPGDHIHNTATALARAALAGVSPGTGTGT